MQVNASVFGQDRIGRLTAEPHDELHLGSNFVVPEEVEQEGQWVNVDGTTNKDQHLQNETSGNGNIIMNLKHCIDKTSNQNCEEETNLQHSYHFALSRLHQYKLTSMVKYGQKSK